MVSRWGEFCVSWMDLVLEMKLWIREEALPLPLRLKLQHNCQGTRKFEGLDWWEPPVGKYPEGQLPVQPMVGRSQTCCWEHYLEMLK